MHKRTVFIGSEWHEAEAFDDVTAHMAARVAQPFQDGYGKKRQPTSWKVNYMGREGQRSSHFYVDGKRVPYARFFALRGLALSVGRIDCFRTEIKGSQVRQYSVYIIPDGKEI